MPAQDFTLIHRMAQSNLTDGGFDGQTYSLKHSINKCCIPDKLVIIQEGCVFDQTEALLHSVDKRLDLQVGHLVQWEEADASEYIEQVAGLQVESLQILETPA